MLALLYLALFIFCGLFIVRCLLPRHSVLTRAWLGASLGLLLMMWLPALMAFAVRFSPLAHGLALLPLAGLCGASFLLRDRRPARAWDAAETTLLHQMLLVVLPLTIMSAWLQYTHCVRIAEDGSWWGGQSTYGDLAMHMSFVTSLKNAAFPPEYALFPGQQLSYPFLTDSLSTSFCMMGLPLQLSLTIPGTLMMALCYMGVMCLARKLTAGKKTVVLAALLFFLNGGLGFIYDFDLAGGAETVWLNGEWTETPKAWNRVQNILNGYYMTPTNQPSPNNLRWSNVIADLMLPQRTLLGGWCMVIPCFYLLFTAFGLHREEASGPRQIALLGVWGGALPLIHTHSFTALALCSAGLLIHDLIHALLRKPSAPPMQTVPDGDAAMLPPEDSCRSLGWYFLYGGIACVLSVPQLFGFTFNQVFQEGMEGASNSFIQLWFNWVNSTDGTLEGMIDGYGWFYVKNIGLPFLMLIFALFEPDAKWRRIFAGALPIILAGEFIRFQPNIYDNNKLLYLAWLLCAMIVADWCRVLWGKLKGFRARPVIALLAAVTIFLSAGLTLWRECVSNYQLFSSGAVQVGEFVRDETEEDAVFLTGVHHLNPVASIGGRRIVCGPDLWLYYHGLATDARKEDVRRFYADPAGNQDVIDTYGVDYIVVSSYERNDYTVNAAGLDALYTRVYQNGEATIWRVAPEGEE